MESNLKEKVEKLRAELKEAERELSEERRERMNAVKPTYRFTLGPVLLKPYHEILDDSIVLIRLEGIVTNAEELEAVGKEVFQGGMTYYFNKLSGKIVTPAGGGNVWVSSEPTFSRSPEEREDARKTFDLLSKFFVENPDGGDVTDIVQTHRAKFKQ